MINAINLKLPLVVVLSLLILAGCNASNPHLTTTGHNPPVWHADSSQRMADQLTATIPLPKASPESVEPLRSHELPPTAPAESSSALDSNAPSSELTAPAIPAIHPLNATGNSQQNPTDIALIDRRIPAYVSDRSGWVRDMANAFNALHIPINPKNICAVVAITEQESSFHSEPVVRGLPNIVRQQLQERVQRYNLPAWSLKMALAMKSPGGGTYAQRIDRLQTENDLNHFYHDFTAEFPLGEALLARYNPVHTGGPMQVSLKFAETHLKQTSYPYHYSGTLRDELFTRRGGLYFGIAYLLNYPVSYDMMLYRFADFNAGRYASRNAAVQKIIGLLSHTQLDLDGDLLLYDGDEPSRAPSASTRALLSLASKLGMSKTAILKDLQLEKSYAFERSELYSKIVTLAENTLGYAFKAEAMPTILLKSPKITHKLTTAGFANRVNERYRACMAH